MKNTGTYGKGKVIIKVDGYKSTVSAPGGTRTTDTRSIIFKGFKKKS